MNFLDLFKKTPKLKHTAEEYLNNWLVVKEAVERDETIQNNIRESFSLTYGNDSSTKSDLYLSQGDEHIVYRVGYVETIIGDVFLATRFYKDNSRLENNILLSEITPFIQYYERRRFSKDINVAKIFGLVQHNKQIGYLTEDLTENGKYELEDGRKRRVTRNGETFFIDPLQLMDSGYINDSKKYLEHILHV